jgi:hypothetical protein
METKKLIEEARKYKSAEEFVRAQGEPVFHWTTYDWKWDFKTDRVFLSKFKDEAEWYAGEQVNNIINRLETETAPNGKSYRPTIKEVFIKKGTKIFDPNKSEDLSKLSSIVKWKEFNAVDAYWFWKVKLSWEEIIKWLSDKTARENWTLFEWDIIDILRKLWYDGWISKERGKETIWILNKSAIKTKDQLIDIYDKANK